MVSPAALASVGITKINRCGRSEYILPPAVAVCTEHEVLYSCSQDSLCWHDCTACMGLARDWVKLTYMAGRTNVGIDWINHANINTTNIGLKPRVILYNLLDVATSCLLLFTTRQLTQLQRQQLQSFTGKPVTRGQTISCLALLASCNEA